MSKDDLTDTERLQLWAPPIIEVPNIPENLTSFDLMPGLMPGRLVRINAAELAAAYRAPSPAFDLIDERARSVSRSFHTWLEARLAEAFAAGKDYAVTRLVTPGDDDPKFSTDTMAWTTTVRWQGQMIEPGAAMGPLWVVYHRPEDWRAPTDG